MDNSTHPEAPSHHTASRELSRRRVLRWGSSAALAAGLAAVATPAVAAGRPSPHRGTARTKHVVYVEVNDHDLGSVARYSLTDGSPSFSHAIIFAANINAEHGRPVLYLNERVAATLADAAHQIRPLQRRGIKVSLSLLGNHQGLGLANLTRSQAEDFAAQVAAVVHRYGLDGVDLDDEYADYGVGGTPAPHAEAPLWLLAALRRRLPHHLITVYSIGPFRDLLLEADPRRLRPVDLAWNPYYPSFRLPELPGIGPSRWGAAAVDLADVDQDTLRDYAARTLEGRYGVFLSYNLQDTASLAQVSTITETLTGRRSRLDRVPR